MGMDIKAQFASLRFSETDEKLLREIIAVSAENGMNTLIIEVEKGVRYDSHPEVSAPWAFTKQKMRGIVDFAKSAGLDVVPLLPTFSHCDYILNAHPELREGDLSGLYCPSNPETHILVNELIDELIDVFEPRYFHIGHDELLSAYNRNDRESVIECESCSKKTPSAIFAEDVIRLRNHLRTRGIRTMMWADMLLDPDEFSSAGFNRSGCYGGVPDDFHLAANLIPKDIILCDWHYELAGEYQSISHLTNMGFEVLGAGKTPINTYLFKDYAETQVKRGFKGMISTMWYHLCESNRPQLLEMAKNNARCLSGDHHDFDYSALVDDMLAARSVAKLPIASGKFKRTISFENGTGGMGAVSWSEFRYVEFPQSSEHISGPHIPRTLDLKSGREGEIAYEFKSEASVSFNTVSLRVWMDSPGSCSVAISAGTGNRVEVAEGSQNGEIIDLSHIIAGRHSFEVRFFAENKSGALAPTLMRFEVEGIAR